MSTATSFTGSSSFSSDLAQFVARAVSFAALPMQQLQAQETTVQTQQSEVSTLQSNFRSIQTALSSLNSSSGTGSFTANIDSDSITSATVSAGAFAGTYSVNVLNTGSHTNTLSKTGLTTVTDPSKGDIQSGTSFSLTVDQQTYTISNSTGSLNDLAKAINASGADVQATVVNIGSSSAPDYRLSVQGSKYSPANIQLSDSSNTPLLDQLSTGSYVQYQVNGSSSTVNSNTRSIQLSTGLSVNVATTGSANITVSQDASGIQNAVSSFVSAYNTAFDELAKSRGQNGGALAGQSIVYQLSSALQNLNGYTSTSGSLTALSDVGITVDQSGHLSFDPSTFNQASSKSVSDVLSFFGTTSTSGFLKSASDILTSVTDSTNGTLTALSNSLASELTDLKAKVSADQDKITLLQTNLTNKMAKADALISSMQQQLSYVTSLFAAQKTAQDSNNQ